MPTGLSFTDHGNGTATISGVRGAGTASLTAYNFTITASNGPGSSQTQPFALTIEQKPVFTSAASYAFVAGQPSSFPVTTTGFPTATLTATTGLPSWAHFTDNGDGTGLLTGTPPAESASASPITITLTATGLTVVTQPFKLTVTQPPTFLTSPLAETFTVGTAIPTVTVATTAGLPSKTTLSIGPKLPAGLTFTDKGTGTATITGTPAAGTASLATYNFTITASNAAGSSNTLICQITIHQKPAFTSAAAVSFIVGQFASFKVVTTGFPTPTLTWTDLPAGLNFTDNHDGTGTISGIPDAGMGCSYPITFRATNAAVTAPVKQAFVLIVNQPPVILVAPTTSRSPSAKPRRPSRSARTASRPRLPSPNPAPCPSASASCST